MIAPNNSGANFEARNIAYQVPENENGVDEALIYDNQQFTLRSTQANTLSFPVANYPTYADYALQMQEFVNNHSDICELVDIGGTTEGAGGGNKRLLFLKISDNISTEEQEPKLCCNNY